MLTKAYPTFWNPKNFLDPGYKANLGLAREEARKTQVEKVSRQLKRGAPRNLLIGIDYEDDFSDRGRLPVKGTFDDAARFGERIIRGVLEEHDSDYIFTIDIHSSEVIHGDTWWRDEMGNPPDVTLPLFMALVDDNPNRPVFEANWVDGRPKKKFSPRHMSAHTVHYSKHLVATGQGYIWVFASHCQVSDN